MKREVIAWYNSLRETWGLELIGEEPEDISGLTLEDFRFRSGETRDYFLAGELHRACVKECASQDGSAGIAAANMNEWAFPGDICVAVETAAGEFAGYISSALLSACDNPSAVTLQITALEIKPEYRGLGLGKGLLSRLLEKADSWADYAKDSARKISSVTFDLPAGQEYFSRVLLRESFKPCVQRFCRT